MKKISIIFGIGIVYFAHGINVIIIFVSSELGLCCFEFRAFYIHIFVILIYIIYTHIYIKQKEGHSISGIL